MRLRCRFRREKRQGLRAGGSWAERQKSSDGRMRGISQMVCVAHSTILTSFPPRHDNPFPPIPAQIFLGHLTGLTTLNHFLSTLSFRMYGSRAIFPTCVQAQQTRSTPYSDATRDITALGRDRDGHDNTIFILLKRTPVLDLAHHKLRAKASFSRPAQRLSARDSCQCLDFWFGFGWCCVSESRWVRAWRAAGNEDVALWRGADAVVRIGTSAGIFHGLVTCLRVFRADSPCFHPSHSDTAGSAIDQRQRIQSTTPPSRSSVTPSNQTQPYTSSFLQPPCRPAHSSASSVACTKFATNKLIKAC
ncbi:hypothetical protein B0H13DRAFT_1131299 [Mycena leptocephala]|nr:hypothetical protein B0H13DRAFT_1131299 [Mycena leptocephala]